MFKKTSCTCRDDGDDDNITVAGAATYVEEYEMEMVPTGGTTMGTVRSTSAPPTKALRHHVKIDSHTGAITIPDGDPIQDTDIENHHGDKREVSQSSVNNLPTAAIPGIADTILQSLTLVVGDLFIEKGAAQIADQLNMFRTLLSQITQTLLSATTTSKTLTLNFFIEPTLTEFVVTAVSEVDGFPTLTLTSRAPESITYHSSTTLRSNVDEITTPSSISVTVDLSTDTTGVTLYGEWSTRRRNSLLSQDGGRTVIIVGSNPTSSLAAPPPIEISFSVSTITNSVINNDVSPIPFDTDTQVRVYAEVEESENQIAEFVSMFFDRQDFDASYRGRSLVGSLVIMVNDTINERVYYADFTTTALFNRLGAEFRFTPRIRGAIIDSFTFQRAGGTVEEGVQIVINDCDSYFGTSGEDFSGIVTFECEGDTMYSEVANPYGWDVNEFFEVGDVFNVDCNNAEPTDEYTCIDHATVRLGCDLEGDLSNWDTT